MQATMTAVGLDVHARSTHAAAIDVVTGELRRSRFGGDSNEVVRWLTELPRPVRAAYEAGPTGFGLARAASLAGIDVLVAAPSKTPRAKGDRVKSDHVGVPSGDTPSPSTTPAASRRAKRRVPLDLLQRRRELIKHYDFHGYPERARYLERAEEGPALLERIGKEESGSLSALLAWWTGSRADEIMELERSMTALFVAERQWQRQKVAPACPPKAIAGLERQRAARGSARALIEDALNAGLAARVNTYMAPLGVPTGDSVAHMFLSAWRELACGSRLAAQAPLPAITLAGGVKARLVYYRRCSVVDLHTRPARCCRRCAKHHERPRGSFRLPRTHPAMPWLVIGDDAVDVRTCEVCGEVFVTKRQHARSCGPGAKRRVAKSRAGRE
jgi:hypothetical protein